jgi:hypothetical protein
VVRAGGDEAAVPVPVAPSSLELAATPAGLSLATGGGTATVPLPDGPTLAEVAVRVTVPGEPERVATTRVPVDRPAPGEVRWLVPAPVAESVGGGPEVRFSLVLGWPAPPPPGPSRPGG